jgi:benzoyl-CoA reductase subunit BamC
MSISATAAGPARSSVPLFTRHPNTAATTRRGRAECAGRDKYTIDGKEYDECAFCRASCPSRTEFKEPDSGLPLKCDMCEGEDEPLCVQWCGVDALTFEEREEEVEEQEEREELEIGLEALANKYGLQKLMDTVARLSKKD